MPGRESKAVRQEQIISAILKIVASKGLNNLTTAALAQEVGLTEGALFKHFPSKEEMLKAAVRKAGHSLVSKVAEIATSTLPPEEKMKSLLNFHLGLLEANPDMSRIIFGIIFSDEVYTSYPSLKGIIREVLDEYASHVEAIFQQGIDQGLFNPRLSSHRLPYILIGLIQGAFIRWHLYEGKLSLKEEAEQIYQVMMLLAVPAHV